MSIFEATVICMFDSSSIFIKANDPHTVLNANPFVIYP